MKRRDKKFIFLFLFIMFKMPNEIFISLKPKFAELIRQRKKTHEFRTYKPRHKVNRFWIYVTQPIALLKYVAEVGEPVEYPAKILDIGDREFNKGLKAFKYAFPILHLYELKKPISLQKLKEKFSFAPPQSFAYANRYKSLVECVRASGLRRIF